MGGDGMRIGVVAHSEKLLGGGLEELRSVLADLGHADPAWIEVPKSKKAPKAVRRLVEKKKVNRLLVWGGDGTVRRCIDTVVREGYDVDVGVLPAGTANLLAKNLDIPIDVRGAVEVAVNGDPVPMDVGRMNGTHFAVMAGTGFDALLMKEADDSGMKDRFGRAGYVWAGVRNRSVEPVHARITVDGRTWFAGDASSVLLGNVGTITGGLQAFPDADPTDGVLEVGVVSARTATQWARVLASTVVHRAERSKFTEMSRGKRFEIRLDRSMPWQVDGGDRDRSKRFTVRCLPGAIRICRPPVTASEPAVVPAQSHSEESTS
jgi:YegS/Rv2252/BmrU family lipid kinase